MHPIRSQSPPVPLLAVLGFTALLALAPRGAAAATTPEAARLGTPITGSMGRTRTTADIVLQEASQVIGEPVVPRLKREHEVDREGMRANPASPRIASVPAMPVDQMVYRPKGLPNRVFSPQTIGVNFTGATLSGVNPTGAFPPDNCGAVGPTQYVVAVNGRLVVFNKTTGLQDGSLSFDMDVFFSSVMTTGSFTSDPQVRYDRLTSRWFVSIIDVATPNRWLLAVTDAASNGTITPATVWTYYFFTPASLTGRGTGLLDYPSLGIDANALYMGGNFFNAAGTAFLGTDAYVIRKSSVLSGGPIVITAFAGLGTSSAGMYTPRGVDNLDPTSSEGYFIGADVAVYGVLNFYRVSNPGTSPTLSAMMSITVPINNQPLTVPHLGNTGGTSGNLDCIDERLFQAMMRGGQLWTASNVKVDNTGVGSGTTTRNGCRWYQLNVPVGSGTPTIVQSGTVFTATGTNLTTERHYWFPAVAVNGQGHAAMGFSTAGTNERINAGTVGRLASDPLGTMQTPVLVTSSATAYNPPSDPGGTSGRRWGDYSLVTVDPLDDQSMWQVEQFCDATNSYGCRVTRLLAPPPSTPLSMPDVPDNQAGPQVTLTLSSSGGSGIYDPGPNLSAPARPFNHLTATITNGSASGTPPTVTAIQYVDPTHALVTLNTVGATPNVGSEKYTITVTNPDGQSASAAVVHIIQSNFTITATAGAGGSITPSGAVTVAPGGDQSFSIAADGCHTLADVLVDGVSQGPVTSYSFTNVQANHTIAASFNAIPYTITASAGPGGSISPNGAVVVNCGTNQAFTITPAACFSIADVTVDGSSVGAVGSYTFTNVMTNHTIDATFSGGVPAPGPVTGLTATQVTFANGPLPTTKITLAFVAPGGTTVEVWRRGFGGYPQYTGSVPAAPASYPPAGWTLTAVTTSGSPDSPGTRDFWYYVAYAKDGCGNVSVASNVTSGTLDYHLGDVSDGATPGQGDNTVNTADVSLLGMHYGATGGALAPFAYLDVGPTTNGSTNGRPTPDGIVEFEDLVLYAVNYTPHVSLVANRPPATNARGAMRSAVDVLAAPAPADVRAGEEFDVPVHLSAAGDLQALSVQLGWNAAVVRPASVEAGERITEAGGVVLSPAPGRADVALLGAGAVLTGDGAIARVRFRAIADGAPAIAITRADGRDAANQAVSIAVHNPLGVPAAVSRTELQPARPNPTSRGAQVSYSLAARGHVDLSIYSIDGRRVKTLARGEQAAGRYQLDWAGTDDGGVLARSGVYIIRLEAAGAKRSRLLTVIR